jgi:transglutaminase-like putative cysteine protease
MIYRVTHNTTYTYSEPVSLCHHLSHLTPRQGPWQTCRHSNLLIEPLPAVTTEHTDYFGNPATFFTVQEPHRQLSMTAVHVAEVTPFEPPEPAQTPPSETVCDFLRTDRSHDGLDAFQFTLDSPYIPLAPELAGYAAQSFPAGRPLLEGVLELTRRIHADFRYDKRATTVATPLREVFAGRHGVCQDFAHLEIGCLRSLGLAARYVSGYLCTIAPPGRSRLVGADASHAWLSVFCPGFGWIDVDPTNNTVPHGQHILLAWGRDYGDVSPSKGVILGGGHHAVSASVDVELLESAEDGQPA